MFTVSYSLYVVKKQLRVNIELEARKVALDRVSVIETLRNYGSGLMHLFLTRYACTFTLGSGGCMLSRG